MTSMAPHCCSYFDRYMALMRLSMLCPTISCTSRGRGGGGEGKGRGRGRGGRGGEGGEIEEEQEKEERGGGVW